jgi:hypothetical protein
MNMQQKRSISVQSLLRRAVGVSSNVSNIRAQSAGTNEDELLSQPEGKSMERRAREAAREAALSEIADQERTLAEAREKIQSQREEETVDWLMRRDALTSATKSPQNRGDRGSQDETSDRLLAEALERSEAMEKALREQGHRQREHDDLRDREHEGEGFGQYLGLHRTLEGQHICCWSSMT